MPLIDTGDTERDALIKDICNQLSETSGAGFEWYVEIMLSALDEMGYEVVKPDRNS